MDLNAQSSKPRNISQPKSGGTNSHHRQLQPFVDLVLATGRGLELLTRPQRLRAILRIAV